MADDVDDEDDYLAMSFADAAPPKETSIQRAARLKRESQARGQVRSKADLAAEAEEKRNAGLATRLDESNNKGAKLMAKFGFKGGALGAIGNEGRLNPIEIELRDNRGGIGMDSEKKRKIRETGEAQEATHKKVKLTEAEYRERNRQEREEKRVDGQWWSAMRTLEGLEEEDEGIANIPLRKINVLYRPLIKERRLKEQNRRDVRSRFDRRLGLDTDDPDMDKDDKLAICDDHEELEFEDDELAEYEDAPLTGRLARILEHLRKEYNYCFWCKHRYDDNTLEGCPGPSEDEHG